VMIRRSPAMPRTEFNLLSDSRAAEPPKPRLPIACFPAFGEVKPAPQFIQNFALSGLSVLQVEQIISSGNLTEEQDDVCPILA